MLHCFCYFLQFFAFRLFVTSFPYYLNYISTSYYTYNIMMSIDLWRSRIGLQGHCKFSDISGCSSDSIWKSATDIPFSKILACVISILLIIGGFEINPGLITPTQEMHYDCKPTFSYN